VTLLLSAVCLFAQSDRGTITGTVSDPAGALIPNAKIVATSTATGVQFNTESTATGNFTIPSMPAGNYDLSVEVAGFRRYTQTGITVQVAVTVRVDVAMQVGNTSESVTVSADAPLLNAEHFWPGGAATDTSDTG